MICGSLNKIDTKISSPVKPKSQTQVAPAEKDKCVSIDSLRLNHQKTHFHTLETGFRDII